VHGDDGIQSRALKGLGVSEARKYLSTVRPLFFENPAEQFEPYKKLC
jgi:hypothetical protein